MSYRESGLYLVHFKKKGINNANTRREDRIGKTSILIIPHCVIFFIPVLLPPFSRYFSELLEKYRFLF